MKSTVLKHCCFLFNIPLIHMNSYCSIWNCHRTVTVVLWFWHAAKSCERGVANKLFDRKYRKKNFVIHSSDIMKSYNSLVWPHSCELQVSLDSFTICLWIYTMKSENHIVKLSLHIDILLLKIKKHFVKEQANKNTLKQDRVFIFFLEV